MRLGINIDHVATIRNARGGVHPDPVKAAKIAANAGADGITAHLREDRRHISDKDIKNLKKSIELPLNLEIAPTEEMLNIALEARPERVCLVPEKRLEITTEGGLEIVKLKDKNKYIIQNIIKECNNCNIDVSLFIDPDINQIISAIDLGVNIIELHTGEYCNSSNPIDELIRIEKAAEFANNNNIEVHAGHGLNFNNVIDIAKIRYIKELNIGHFIIGESIFMGLESAVKKMKNIIVSCK
jgi:pyridoxine 5-phosphate synthase